ncbi:hypothetical protein NLO86_27985, partial [Pseudomonas savastanoi]|uniref:hypothetical protein n=1 Tax=Pseudomonas savastanoi TaxID=29438 RepID=UPI00210DBA36
MKELSVPRVGTVGYFCSASLMGMNANQRLRYLKITRKDKSTLAELNFLPAKRHGMSYEAFN